MLPPESNCSTDPAQLERRVNHLEHDQLGDADASQTKENAFMLLQRARAELARARAQLAGLMHT